MMIVRTVVLAAATLLTGLMAGLFFAYSCSVMPGLSATDNRSFVRTIQWINRRILNGCAASRTCRSTTPPPTC